MRSCAQHLCQGKCGVRCCIRQSWVGSSARLVVKFVQIALCAANHSRCVCKLEAFTASANCNENAEVGPHSATSSVTSTN